MEWRAKDLEFEFPVKKKKKNIPYRSLNTLTSFHLRILIHSSASTPVFVQR